MMADNTDKDVQAIWNDRWHGSQVKERLAVVGKMMFRSKQGAIKKLLREVEVRNAIEIGCGLGYTLAVFKNMGIDAFGIDISDVAVQVCQGKGLAAKLGKLEDILDKYELVSSDGMLEHFLNMENYAKHLVRISSKYILLIQPNYSSFVGKTTAYLANLMRGSENVYEYNYRIQDFINVFKRCGTRLIRDDSVFFNIFRILLFEKEFDGGSSGKGLVEQ